MLPTDKRDVRVRIRKTAGGNAPFVKELHMSNRRLPWLMYGKVYVVSDMARRYYSWRPDFVSPSDLSSNGDGVEIAGCFLGNPGYSEWISRSEPWDSVIVAFWPHDDLHCLTRKALRRKRTLVFHLMGVKSSILDGAINIPPMLHDMQVEAFRNSLQKRLPVQYIGELPQYMPTKWRPFEC